MELLIISLLLLIAAEVAYVGYRATRSQQFSSNNGRVFVDTSVLIDGRIVPVSASGFITSTLSIPRSVVGELQLLADSADGDKRSKARRGLDVIAELQGLDTVTVEIFADSRRADEGVDNRLLSLARKYSGAICTVDYNLNKVAKVEGIRVLNVNELALSLRMPHLPGERIMLELTTKGNDARQAVGHLDDGTMVVVEQAKSKIGQRVEVEVIRSLQTSAGRMMFARLVDQQSSAQAARPQNDKKHKLPVGRSKRAQASKIPEATTELKTQADSRQKPKQTRKHTTKRGDDREARLIELVNKQ